MKEREGNPDCFHDWVYDTAVVLSEPTIYHRICKKCGRLEHDEIESGMPTVFNAFHFDQLNKHFTQHGDTE